MEVRDEFTGHQPSDETLDLRRYPDLSKLIVSYACLIVSEELKKHEDFYMAFVDSVLSVIKSKSRYIGDGETEIVAEFGENYLAEEIVRRIAGEE